MRDPLYTPLDRCDYCGQPTDNPKRCTVCGFGIRPIVEGGDSIFNFQAERLAADEQISLDAAWDEPADQETIRKLFPRIQDRYLDA